MNTEKNEVNTVVLSKTSYDIMRGTNDRASMLLREIMDEVIAIVVRIAVAIVVVPLSAVWVAVAMVADYMGET